MNKTVKCPLCERELEHTDYLKAKFEVHSNNLINEQMEKDKLKKEVLKYQASAKETALQVQVMKKENDLKVEQQTKIEVEKQVKIKEALIFQQAKAQAEEILMSKSAKLIQQGKKEAEDSLKQKEKEILEKGINEGQRKHLVEIVESQKEVKAHQLKVTRLEDDLSKMKNKLASKDVELNGAAQEDLIMEFIEKNFPDDDVVEIGKGKNGNDCNIIINEGSKKNIGIIGIESKNTKAFENKWVDKLQETLVKDKIDFGVIITKSMPKNFKGLELRFNDRIAIIPMIWDSIYMFIHALRLTIITQQREKRINGLSQTKQGELYNRLIQPSLNLKVRDFLTSFSSEQKLIDDDAKYWTKSHTFRKKNLENKKSQIMNIFAEIAGGDEKLTETLLESKETDVEIIQLSKVYQLGKEE